MRNLMEFPIDDDEILECLKTLSEQLTSEGRIGDMRPMLLTEAAKRLEISVCSPCPPWDEMLDDMGRVEWRDK